METRIGRIVLISAVVATSMLGGCVSRDAYQRALNANVTAQEQLQLVREDLAETSEKIRLMSVDIEAAKRATQQKQQVIDQLQESLRQGEARFAELQARYDRDTRDVGPAPLGAIALPVALDQQLMQWADQFSNLVEYDRRRGMVKFKTDLVFASGSDMVGDDARKTLERFAQILKDDTSGYFHIYIAGHTDDVPIGKPETRRRHPNNWYLSVHRAVSVMEVLASNGIPEDKLGVMGFSEFHPVAPNAPGKKGSALNRRVEIWIVPPTRFMTTEEKSEPQVMEEK